MTEDATSSPTPPKPWYGEHALLLWAIVLGLVAVWRYTVPVVYNRIALAQLIDIEPFFCMLYMTPSPIVEDERFILFHVGIALVAFAFVLVFPSAVRKQMTWWTVLLLVLSTAGAVFFALAYTPLSLAFWYALLGAGVLLAIGAACEWPPIGSSSQVSSPAPIRQLTTRVLAFVGVASYWCRLPVSLERNRRILLTALIAILSLLNVFVLVPAVCARWDGKAKAEFGLNPHILYLLRMKNPNSPFHGELVNVLLQNDDYLLVQPSDQVPHTELFPGAPATLPADPSERHVTFFAPLPTLVSRDQTESLTYVMPPADFRKALEESLRNLGPPATQPTFEIRRVPGGGYGINFKWSGWIADLSEDPQAPAPDGADSD
jgi:hypothetical protein